jgi:glyoxylase-like metal-dependent hydrolase (beta-lactamase superfamily II)
VREGDVVIDASSTATLVESEGKLMIVDTGSAEDSDEIDAALKDHGVACSDIDFVVNTHLHRDHSGCNELFVNARVCAHELEAPPLGSLSFSGEMTLLRGVEVVPTPGHTMGSISVFVHSDRRYAICGDAIPTRANYDQMSPPFIACDKRLAMKSLEMIVSWADVIIPGHDGPIDNRRK